MLIERVLLSMLCTPTANTDWWSDLVTNSNNNNHMYTTPYKLIDFPWYKCRSYSIKG